MTAFDQYCSAFGLENAGDAFENVVLPVPLDLQYSNPGSLHFDGDILKNCCGIIVKRKINYFQHYQYSRERFINR